MTSRRFRQIRSIFHFVKTLLKMLIVANVADYWGVLLFVEYAAHMREEKKKKIQKPEADDKGDD